MCDKNMKEFAEKLVTSILKHFNNSQLVISASFYSFSTYVIISEFNIVLICIVFSTSIFYRFLVEFTHVIRDKEHQKRTKHMAKEKLEKEEEYKYFFQNLKIRLIAKTEPIF